MAGRLGASQDNVIWGVDFVKREYRPFINLAPWEYEWQRAMEFVESHWPTPEGDEFVGPDGDCA